MSSKRILVTGGAGYIGSVLVPRLLLLGHSVTVYDQMYFGPGSPAEHPQLIKVRGDVRDERGVAQVLAEGRFDVVIHLAAVSNDPGADLAPELTTDINLTATAAIMRRAREAGVSRFLYASSASVYGVKATPDVHEGLSLEPLTLYARYKAEGERVLNDLVNDDFVGVSVRSATVCGPSPRLRLDLTVNIFTHQAISKGKLTIFGGSQSRPNVHVEDLCDFYVALMDAPASAIQGQAFNVVKSNATVGELAALVKQTIAPTIPLEISPSNDLRSYCLSGARAEQVLGFRPRRSLTDAIEGLAAEYKTGRVPDPESKQYRNVEWMRLHLGDWAWSRQT